MSNYWSNRRRREAQKGKPVVHNTLRRIEFSVDNVPYVYEYKTDSRSGFDYIYRGTELIHGPYKRTEEGYKIEKLLRDNKII